MQIPLPKSFDETYTEGLVNNSRNWGWTAELAKWQPVLNSYVSQRKSFEAIIVDYLAKKAVPIGKVAKLPEETELENDMLHQYNVYMSINNQRGNDFVKARSIHINEFARLKNEWQAIWQERQNAEKALKEGEAEQAAEKEIAEERKNLDAEAEERKKHWSDNLQKNLQLVEENFAENKKIIQANKGLQIETMQLLWKDKTMRDKVAIEQEYWQKQNDVSGQIDNQIMSVRAEYNALLQQYRGMLR